MKNPQASGEDTAVHARREAADGTWWQRAVIYEIAPISFQDSNEDGKGDLPGLLERIDYLHWLGVDAIWLTPVFRSPMLAWATTLPTFAPSIRFSECWRISIPSSRGCMGAACA